MKKIFDINPGTTVWVMYKDTLVCGVVEKVWSNTYISPLDFETVEDSVWYHVKIGEFTETFRRKDLFLSKEELKKSL